MAGTPLAEAFVRVRALTDKFKDDVEKGFSGLGDDFARQFSKDASARLKAERGVFEDEGQQIGDKAGTAAGREFADRMKDNGVRFGDDASPFVEVGKKLGTQVGKAFSEQMAKQTAEGLAKATDAIKKYELGLSQAELAARRAGLAAREAAERAKAAGDLAAAAAEKVEKGELKKEEATRLAAKAAVEQEKAEIAAANAGLAKAKVSEKAAQLAQAYAKAQAGASQETDRLGGGVRRLVGDLDRSGSSMGALAGVAKGLAGSFTSVASSLAKVGAGAAGIAAVGAAASSAAGYTVALTAALAPVSGLLAGLPGIALTGAAAFSVWKLAAGGLGEAMSAVMSDNPEAINAAMAKLSDSGRTFTWEMMRLTPQLAAFKGLAQDPFLEPLLGQMGRWLTSARELGPAIGSLGGEFGRLVRTALDFATSSQTLASFGQIMAGTQRLVEALRSSLTPLLRGFVDLGVVGNEWLGRMSGGLADVLTRFGEWMSRISESGQAMAWLDASVEVLKQFGTLVKDVFGILTGLLKASSAAGENALGVLGSLVGAFNKWVNSARGQEVLVEIFKALNDIGAALLPVITALGGAIAAIAPQAAKVATALGPVLGRAIDALGPAIAALGPGLIGLVEGIGAAVDAIAPVLTSLGGEIGSIMSALGRALALIIPQIANIALALAPALTAAVSALGPALAALGPGLTAVAQALARAFASPEMQAGLLALGNGLSNMLVALAPLLPLVAQVAGVLGQVLGAALTNLGSLLTPIIAALGRALEPALRAISGALNMMLPLMQPIYQAFGDIGAALISQLLPPLLNLVPVLISSLIPAFAELMRQVQPLIPLLADLAVKFINEVLPAIIPFIPELTKMSLEITKLGLVLAQLVVTVAPIITQIISLFQHLYDTLVGNSIIPDLINGIRDWFQRGVDWVKGIVQWFAQLPGMFSNWLGGVRDRVSSAWNDIRNAISDRVNDIRNRISDGLNQIGNRWTDAWNSVRNAVSNAWSNITGAVAQGVNNVMSFFYNLPGQISGAMGNLGNLLYGAGQSMMQGLINGLYSMWQTAYNAASDILGHIRNLFPFSPAKEGPFSGKGWTLYSGRSMVAGLAQGVLQEEGALTSAMDQVLRAGAGRLAPSLPAFDVPSPAPAFAGAFPIGHPALPAAAPAGGRVVNVENIYLQGVFDPSNPVSYRRTVEQLREAIRELEDEEYADV